MSHRKLRVPQPDCGAAKPNRQGSSKSELKKIAPKHGKYYDLIALPHGHIPAPMVNLWSGLPLSVKGVRGEDFYFCPVCGEPSFFKIRYACRWCEEDLVYEDGLEEWAYRRYERKLRRDYFRELWKKIEYLFLPVLAVFGKAYYVKSTRLHPKDYGENYVWSDLA